MLSEIISHLIDIAFTGLIGYLVWFLKEERKERKANSMGMKEILGYMIDRWHEEFILQGYVTSEQRNTFDDVYKAYAANKGNGARKTKWEEVQRLHVDDTKSGMSPFLKLYLDHVKEKQEECKEGSSN